MRGALAQCSVFDGQKKKHTEPCSKDLPHFTKRDLAPFKALRRTVRSGKSEKEAKTNGSEGKDQSQTEELRP